MSNEIVPDFEYMQYDLVQTRDRQLAKIERDYLRSRRDIYDEYLIRLREMLKAKANWDATHSNAEAAHD